MTQTAPADPIAAAIKAAVRDELEVVFAEQIRPLLEELVAKAQPAEAPAAPAELSTELPLDGYVSVTRACELLAINRSTLIRRERKGELPVRKSFPDGRVGYLRSQWETFFANATDYKRDPAKSAERAARFH